MTAREVAEFIERWHEFYLLAGTAAVTLVGLLFLALSLNLETLIHDTREHLLRHARATLLSFIYVLLVSLMFLVPDQPLRQVAISLTAISMVFVVMQIRFNRSARQGPPAPQERTLRVRNRLMLIIYALSLINGIALFLTNAPQLLYNMIALVCTVLGNSAGASWFLLVEVGRLKSTQSTSTKD